MKRKTILKIETTSKEYDLQYSGSIKDQVKDKSLWEHDKRLIIMLVSNRDIFNFFLRIVEPAKRYYQREDRKKLREQSVYEVD